MCFLFQDGDDGFGQKTTYRAFAEPVALLPHTTAATKGSLPRKRCWARHFVKTSTNVPPPHIMDSWCGNGATRLRAWQRGRAEYKKAPDLAARRELSDQTRGRCRKLGGNQAKMNKQYSGQSWRAAVAGVSAWHGGAARPALKSKPVLDLSEFRPARADAGRLARMLS